MPVAHASPVAFVYRDRRHAGRVLAELLGHQRGVPNLLILGLPRGGVPVGYEVAGALGAPLDVYVVRKIGVPAQPEMALGAVGSGGVLVMNQPLVDQLKLPTPLIDAATRQALDELRRREDLFRGGRPLDAVAGKRVILIDDGLATGSTMRAAVSGLYRMEPERIIVAVPVSPPDTVRAMRGEVDELVCPNTPAYFGGVGAWYEDFTQTTDEEVRDLLSRSHRMEQGAAHP
jgi:putative phosphoribosyl transferase